ncbi:transcriptional regulator domain-containing protein [Sphingobium sp. Leaf26]|uniref:transcriptional regulator domain-containing protein n=1 Tax=Sphingobium sp. Leaf26 TaxID=1735693 RepID=UPI000A446C67
MAAGIVTVSQDRCDYAQAFLSYSPAYRAGYTAIATRDRQAKEDFARSWGLRFPL